MLVERSDATCYHVLVRIAFCLAEHCPKTHNSEVDMHVLKPMHIVQLESFARAAYLLSDVIHPPKTAGSCFNHKVWCVNLYGVQLHQNVSSFGVVGEEKEQSPISRKSWPATSILDATLTARLCIDSAGGGFAVFPAGCAGQTHAGLEATAGAKLLSS